MRPLRFILLLLLAAILFAEPVVHVHPLRGVDASGNSSTSGCALCAVSAQNVTAVRSLVVAPAPIIDQLVAARPRLHSVSVFVPLPSRAPPAA